MKIDQGKRECVGRSPVKIDRLFSENKGFGHTWILVLVRGDWQKESQFIPTTHRTLGSVEVLGPPNFENTSFGRPILFIFTTLTTQIFFSVSIVKRGATVITLFLGPRTKKEKIQKKNIYSKK
jgi:hypothetical protein